MINQDAIRLLDHFYGQPSFFSDNLTSFSKNVEVYSLLKRQFQAGPVTENPAFCSRFASFYRMRFVSAAGKHAFFQKMEQLRQHHDGLDPRLFTEELYLDMGQHPFSFVTKMLHHPVVETFRTRFNCPDMGTMKVLDALFWRLGKILNRDGEGSSPMGFLSAKREFNQSNNA